MMQVVPLAPKQLSTPHHYHPDYEVFLQLDQPLWIPRPGAKDVAMEIISLCIQLDSVILSSKKECVVEEEEGGAEQGKVVTFRSQRLVASKLAAMVKLMQEHLSRAGLNISLEDYFWASGLSILFPRVELYLQEPNQLLDQVPSPILEGYFSHMTHLNTILSMAGQIHSHLLSSTSHKSMAHEVALLYQSVGSIPQLAEYKREIESHFAAIKTCCSPTSSTAQPPRLTDALRTWLLELTQKLTGVVVSLPEELFASHQHVEQVLSVIHSVPHDYSN